MSGLGRHGTVHLTPAQADALLGLAIMALRERRRRDGAALSAHVLDVLDQLDAIAAGRDRCEVASVSAGPVMLGLSVRAAAERLECSPQWVRCLLGAGRLRGHRTGGHWVVDPDDLERFRRRAA
jgi:excisionase family DNA binding protein